MEANSNEYIEKNEKDCSLQVTTHQITVGMGLTAFPFDTAKPLTFYKDSVQYVKVTLNCSKEIPTNSYLRVSFGNSKVIKGTGYLITGVNQSSNSSDFLYEYETNAIIVSNLASVTAMKEVSLSVRVHFSLYDLYVNATGSYDSNKTAATPLF